MTDGTVQCTTTVLENHRSVRRLPMSSVHNLSTMHCIFMHCAFCTVFCTVRFALWNVHCALLYTVQYVLRNMHYAL